MNMGTSEIEESAVTKPPPPREHRRPSLRKGRRRGFRRLIKWGVVLLVLSGIGVGWWVHWRHQAQLASAAASAEEIVTVEQGTVERNVEASGGVAANQEVEIKCRAAGAVIQLPFQVSEHVKKGDLVCQLDPTIEQLNVRQAQVTALQSQSRLAQASYELETAQLALQTTKIHDAATLAYAQVRAANLKSKAARQKALVEQKLGSQEDLETAETESASALADLQAAQVAVDELQQQEVQIKLKQQAVVMADAQQQADQVTLDTQKQNLAFTTVNSPLDGVVSKLSVQKGTIVASGTDAYNGGTAILTICDLSRIFVNAKVDESDIGVVQVGQDAQIVVSSYPDRTFTGKVIRKFPEGEVNANIVTFQVIIEVTGNDKNLLLPQMTGNTTIVQARRENVLTLPSTAIHFEKDKASVKMADGSIRQIEVGLRSADSDEILSGLKLHDRVVVGNSEMFSRWKNSDDE
jgi:HlyD family secretion protein